MLLKTNKFLQLHKNSEDRDLVSIDKCIKITRLLDAPYYMNMVLYALKPPYTVCFENFMIIRINYNDEPFIIKSIFVFPDTIVLKPRRLSYWQFADVLISNFIEYDDIIVFNDIYISAEEYNSLASLNEICFQITTLKEIHRNLYSIYGLIAMTGLSFDEVDVNLNVIQFSRIANFKRLSKNLFTLV